MSYLIEKDVPFKKDRFPFADMEIGDSFYVGEGLTRSIVFNAANRGKYKIATRTEGKGYRVWLMGKVTV